MNRITELEATIRYHNRCYFTEDNPVISDFEYDKLVAELRSLSPNSSVFSEFGTPTFGRKIKHLRPMGSLLKAHSSAEVGKSLGHRICAMPKIDGLSLSVIYKNGVLYRAVTRGDGFEGEDVTANAKMIQNLPTVIYKNGVLPTQLDKSYVSIENPATHELEIRGEVYVDKTWFFANMANQFANPRNYAAGSLKQKNPEITKQRNLRFIAYIIDANCVSKQVELSLLQMLGFETSYYQIIGNNIPEIDGIIKHFEGNRQNFPFDIDGIVFWLDKKEDFDAAGMTGITPNGAIAYKFNTDKVKTTINNIEWNVTRTGRIVPVAIVQEVFVAGTNVRRMTLNNLDFVQRNDIMINDTILLEKANEIIPKYVETVEKSPVRFLNTPTDCPDCLQPVSIDGKDIVCMNRNCPSQISSKLLHFLRAMKIKGFSVSTVEKLIQSGELNSRSIFELTIDDFRNLGLGPKQALDFKNLLTNLQLTPAQFLNSLGIHGAGLKTWENLLEVFNFKKLIDEIAADKLTRENYEKLFQSVVGFVTGNLILDGLNESKNFILQNLPFISITETPINISGGKLSGFSFCITGTLSKPRNHFVELIEKNGGTFQGVNKNLNYLIVGSGSDGGSKITAAKKFNVKMINEQDFQNMIQGSF